MTTEQGLTALRRLREQLHEILVADRPDVARARMLGEHVETARRSTAKTDAEALKEYRTARSLLARIIAKAA